MCRDFEVVVTKSGRLGWQRERLLVGVSEIFDLTVSYLQPKSSFSTRIEVLWKILARGLCSNSRELEPVKLGQ